MRLLYKLPPFPPPSLVVSTVRDQLPTDERTLHCQLQHVEYVPRSRKENINERERELLRAGYGLFFGGKFEFSSRWKKQSLPPRILAPSSNFLGVVRNIRKVCSRCDSNDGVFPSLCRNDFYACYKTCGLSLLSSRISRLMGRPKA